MFVNVAGRSYARQAASCEKFVSAAATLAASEQLVRATANTATDSYDLRMPPVADAAGRMYSITADIANAKVVTLKENKTNDSIDWPGDFLMDTDEDGLLLYSDGRQWWVVGERDGA